MTGLLQDSFLSKEPIVRLAFAFNDEFEGKGVGIIIVLEGVLVGEQLRALSPNKLYVAEEMLAVFIHPSSQLLTFLLHFAVEIFDDSLNFYLHLFLEAFKAVLHLIDEEESFFKIELDELVIAVADGAFIHQLD